MIITVSSLKGIQCQISDSTVVVDPPSNAGGTVVIRTKVTMPLTPVAAEVLQGPGEYEILGITVRGIALDKEADARTLRTAYVVTADGMRLCFVGNLTTELEGWVVDTMGKVDILFMPVGKELLSAKRAASLIRQIDPRIVILTESRKDAELLAEALGQKLEPMDKLAVKSKDLSEETTKVIWIVGK